MTEDTEATIDLKGESEPEQASLRLQVRLAASREEVWKLVGDFGALDQWNPMVPNCALTEDGLSRRITLPGIEVIETLDPEAAGDWSHSYTVERSPMPIKDYRATLSVREEGDGCVVEYSSTFVPRGVPGEMASAMLKGFFDAGFKTLQERFGEL